MIKAKGVFLFFMLILPGIIKGMEKNTSVLTLKHPTLDQFWQKTLHQLASVPMDAKIDKLHIAVPFKEYKITLNSLGGIKICALLALPVRGEDPDNTKPWPVIVTVPGYGGSQQGVMLSECQRGYAILQVFPRGQGLSSAYWKVLGGQDNKLTMELKRPQGAYYQGCYADVIQMINFVVTQKYLDSSRIALVATSQGGGIALAVTALDHRVKTVVAHVPFLCDIPLAANTRSLVKSLLDRAGENNKRAIHTLEYFDPLQLASKIHVAVLMSAGGRDHTCPMQTIQAVYQRIPSTEKELKLYPNLTHTSCLDFYRLSWIWLDKYL